MKLLALETSVTAATVALHDGALTTELAVDASASGPSGSVLVCVDRLMASAGVQLADLDGIVVGSGPGSFTGVRVACAVAQGLGVAAGVPVIPVLSIDALASTCAGDFVLALLDARMEEVYWAIYGPAAEGLSRIGDVLCTTPERISLPDSPHEWRVCGSGIARYRTVLPGEVTSRIAGEPGASDPTAGMLIRYFLDRASQLPGVDAAALAPHYVRNKVALTTRERNALKAGQ
ncbi:tRNA (adenosine(37)-N6)-threonylcarbamoyltransferase complex dimerization subunit type 1 TsaB [Niveibacterium umoris]|uniref:tRNA threonylcarbamoyladenosine biosynthesis protein TsaB n=1 Tax=Niveibacterium umoris TaxID=1193620 RepID=A0A840BB38_9RHOO|nr:tRNA (adenosine(37)-N6)-threonylcarbamoyltransferase complex dimerization subunit type 1 TsaB [Niveibacterium umoris]MBB4010741.1 tRNA threonylcarbamoyladenosine biosynthesis protein TsaB [Niveibacterium umoris]